MAALARYLPKILHRGAMFSAQHSMELVETLHLGVDRTLYLIRVEDTRLLVAGSRNGMVLLTQFKQTTNDEEPEQVSQVWESGFGFYVLLL